MSFWNPIPQPEELDEAPDCEIDIEGLSIVAIERDVNDNGDECTALSINASGESLYIISTLEQHNAFVKRFRDKLNRAQGQIQPR